ncbi:hypothetical protein VNI00_010111 [Paramarasmius palmivorus]|uniref:Uncharacterized protein n=1 Tax=Paramarasmius palmivorus TaxID=297713 RepID=A0AAW0CIX6_9AGAR
MLLVSSICSSTTSSPNSHDSWVPTRGVVRTFGIFDPTLTVTGKEVTMTSTTTVLNPPPSANQLTTTSSVFSIIDPPTSIDTDSDNKATATTTGIPPVSKAANATSVSLSMQVQSETNRPLSSIPATMLKANNFTAPAMSRTPPEPTPEATTPTTASTSSGPAQNSSNGAPRNPRRRWLNIMTVSVIVAGAFVRLESCM